MIIYKMSGDNTKIVIEEWAKRHFQYKFMSALRKNTIKIGYPKILNLTQCY